MYIHQTFKQDFRYVPVKEIEEKEFPREEKAIEHLQKTGGGIYRNIVHNFEIWIPPFDKTQPKDP